MRRGLAWRALSRNDQTARQLYQLRVQTIAVAFEDSEMALKFARPIHTGEYLREEYLAPLGMSAGALAKRLNLPRTRIERIVKEETGITPDTALRLGRFFNTTPQFWMNFQQSYELETTAKRLESELSKVKPLHV
jgi:addiction module HigA family antidote